MTLVPDAPWWANVLLVLTLTIIPSVFAVKARHEAKRSADTAEASQVATANQLGRVLHNVENSHEHGLRDDLDDKFAQVVSVVEALRDDVGGMHGELRDARSDVDHVRRDIRGIRQDARTDRRRISVVERRFTSALEIAQDLLDANHPGGPRISLDEDGQHP